VVEPGGHRDLLAEVATEAEQHDAGVAFADPAQQAQRVVAVAVVDVEHFRRDRQRVEHRREPAMKVRNHRCFVEDRHHDRQHHVRLLGRHGRGRAEDRKQRAVH